MLCFVIYCTGIYYKKKYTIYKYIFPLSVLILDSVVCMFCIGVFSLRNNRNVRDFFFLGYSKYLFSNFFFLYVLLHIILQKVLCISFFLFLLLIHSLLIKRQMIQIAIKSVKLGISCRLLSLITWLSFFFKNRTIVYTLTCWSSGDYYLLVEFMWFIYKWV